MPVRRCIWTAVSVAAGSALFASVSPATGQPTALPSDTLVMRATSTRAVVDTPGDAASDEAVPLPLDVAIAEALGRNPDLGARRAEVDVARERPAQERSLMPPMLSAQIWQWPVSSVDPRNTGGYMVMAEQSLPGRGKRALRERAARAEIAVREHEVDTDARQVIEAVTHAYTDLALARRSAEVYRANLGLLRQLADSAQSRYAAGHVAQADVLQPLVEIARIHDRLLEEEERAAIAEARLNRWLGRSVDRPIGPLDRLQDRRLVASASELQRLAEGEQPALQVSAAEIAHAGARLDVTEADARPDFSVQAGYMFMPREGDRWTAQLAITWPRAPWARPGIAARVAESRRAVTAARARHAVLEQEIRLAVQEAYVRVKTAERRVALLETSIVPQIEQTFAVVRAAYQADHAELLSAIDVQRRLLETQLEHVQATAAFSSALAELGRAVGADLTGQVVPVPAPRRPVGLDDDDDGRRR